MTRTRLLALTACVVLAACGADDETPEEATDGAGDAAVVTIVDFDFDQVPEVVAGGTIMVENTGGAPHTMTAADGTFDTGSISGGSTAELVVDAPGAYDFACTIHPSMTGTLVVVNG